tara:strand:+ start:497 stop:778 length:282 start_codon:yes stop_codon:yes gene_type:complete
MKIQELMERLGVSETGKVIAYVKDALQELNKLAENDIATLKIDIDKDRRFYSLPNDSVKILDIRCKNQLNDKDEYRSIPRLIHEPPIKDADGS